MRSRWDARLSSPKLSVHGPMLSPKKSISQPDLNSPLSLESLIAYQKSRRMLAFTPPSSPSRNKEHASPIYSVMGPSGR
ncbi:MAG: hypothetical protein P1U61_03630 [Legionellaceae bacterium]|nr:hypothetical protein [Legionellaceae bacterium]